MMKYFFAAVMFMAGAAHACNVPNPNLVAPPFVDGCALPAVALNRLLTNTPPAVIVDNQTGAMTVDRVPFSSISQSGLSGQAIYNQAVGSGGSNIFNAYDGIRGIVSAPASSTVNTITGVAGYVINNTVPIGQRSQTAAIFGIDVCAVNSSNCWGIDTITSDNPTQNNTGITSGTGKFLFNEFDLEITSPNTQGANLQVGGTALPTNTTLNVNAIGINKLWGSGGQGTGTSLYSNGFIASDACCAIGLNLGAMALSGASSNSMPFYLNYRSATNVYENIALQAVPAGSGTGGTLFIGGTGSAQNLLLVAGGLFLASNQPISWNTITALTADGVNTLNLGTMATWTTVVVGNSSATVNLAGSSITAPALPTQAHAGSNACVGYNASTHALYISSTVTTC